MGRWICLREFDYGKGHVPAGAVLSEEVGDPIAMMMAEGVPLVVATPELEALALRMRDRPEMIASLASARPLQADRFGVVHLYVDGRFGSDANGGTSPGDAYRTWGAWASRYAEWVALRLPNDVRVHVSGDTFVESVRVVLPCKPLGRLRVTGDRASMTLMRSGVSGAGTDEFGLTAAGGAFGTAREHIGYTLRVTDPATGVEQRTTVAEHSNTRALYSGNMSFVATPAAGWSYGIYRPSTRLVAPAGKPALVFVGGRVNRMGLDDAGQDACILPGGGAVVFEDIEFVRDDDFLPYAVKLETVSVHFCGCVISGQAQALIATDSSVDFGNVFVNETPDPFLDLGAFDYTRWTCSLGVRRTGGGIPAVLLKHSTIAGMPVVIGSHGLALDDSYGVIIGGAIHAGNLSLVTRSWLRAFNFLVKDSPAGQPAVQVGADTFFGGNTHFELLGPLTIDGALGTGIEVADHCTAHLTGPVTTGPGGIAGVGLDVRGNARVGLDTGVAWTSVGNQVRVDGTALTFAAITTAVKGQAPGTTGTGALVFRNPP